MGHTNVLVKVCTMMHDIAHGVNLFTRSPSLPVHIHLHTFLSLTLLSVPTYPIWLFGRSFVAVQIAVAGLKRLNEEFVWWVWAPQRG